MARWFPISSKETGTEIEKAGQSTNRNNSNARIEKKKETGRKTIGTSKNISILAAAYFTGLGETI